MPPETDSDLEQIAKNTGRTKTECAVKAITEYLERQKNRQQKKDKWLKENQAALNDYNRRIESHGTFSCRRVGSVCGDNIRKN